jgi:membrane protease YdiL (CAAX protease family)
VHGLIWALWHTPLIIAGLYVAGPLGPHHLGSAAIFIVYVVAFAYVFARFRLATGSIWPCAVLHGAWNAVLIDVFDKWTHGSQATIWTGEGGLLVMGTMIMAAFLVSRGRWTMIRTLPRRGQPLVREPLG